MSMTKRGQGERAAGEECSCVLSPLSCWEAGRRGGFRMGVAGEPPPCFCCLCSLSLRWRSGGRARTAAPPNTTPKSASTPEEGGGGWRRGVRAPELGAACCNPALS